MGSNGDDKRLVRSRLPWFLADWLRAIDGYYQREGTHQDLLLQTRIDEFLLQQQRAFSETA